MKYNTTYHINDGNGKTQEVKGTVEFAKKENDYGNGYHMCVKSPVEPFGFTVYDIRYDTDFSPAEAISYIVSFFDRRFDGEDGAWKLLGIRVHEMDDDE